MYYKGYGIRSYIDPVMTICSALCRKKKLDESSITQSSLARVLNAVDLTFLGVGSTLGVGIYVLAGEVSKTVAGPAVVISFLLAAIASIFAGLCYAEFGARVPKAGSAYVYSYYCMGEIIAFVIGWNLILEYVIGSASVARGISTYVDSLLSNKIRNFFVELAPMDSSFMSPYVDLFAFGLCILLAFALAFGVKESTIINNFLTFCNLSIVAFIIISGLFKADFHNWNLDKSELPGAEAGKGGFAPFGVIGIIKGAAICFYGFVGFDCIATTGEEVKNPQRAIPLSIMVSLMITFFAYFGISSVLTLMWPYYKQDPDAPIPYVYAQLGWEAAKWLVSIGALFGLFSSLFGAMFPLPRIIYAMASDGLIFRALGEVNPKTKTPVIGTAVAGLVTATMAALFNLQQLICLMALGTLLAYTIVAISVLILRYSPDFDNYKEINESTGLVSQCNYVGFKELILSYFSCGCECPSNKSKKIVVFNITIFSILSVIVALLILRVKDCDGIGHTTSITLICILGTIMLIVFLSICSQPKARKCLPFQMPLVPLLPCLSIFLNIYLMVVLDATTWIRFIIWMSIGFIPYLIYYIRRLRRNELGENSRYNVNRMNNIKLNELVWELQREKRSLIEGYMNEAFVGDERAVADDGRDSSIAVCDTHRDDEKATDSKASGADEIYVYMEEASELNNNRLREKDVKEASESEDEKWRSVAEVHAAVSDNEDDNQDAEPKTEVLELAHTGEHVIHDKVDERPSESGQTEANKETPEAEVQGNGSNKQIESGSDTARPLKPNMKIVLESKLKAVDFSKQADDTPLPAEAEKGIDVARSQFRDKLNNILMEQATLIRHGLSKSGPVPEPSVTESESTDTNHVDVKTLTKSQIMKKLQDLLKNGPPGKPSFRRAPVVDAWMRCVEEGGEEHQQEGT